jgi:hypothetical protein
MSANGVFVELTRALVLNGTGLERDLSIANLARRFFPKFPWAFLAFVRVEFDTTQR